MKRKTLIISALVSLGLLVTLLIKLIRVPGGMILPGWFLGGMMIILILLAAPVLAWLIKLIVKRLSFWTAYFILTAIAFMAFHYQLYSPTLKIIVPENYTGEVNLIKSNVADNILRLDSNGIGYLNEWTFNKVYSKPIVLDSKGNDLTEQLVGFNPSTFWGLRTTTLFDSNKEIKTKTFDIAPNDKIGEKQYYHINLSEVVDRKKIK